MAPPSSNLWSRAPILNPNETDAFHKYFESTADAEDVFGELGYQLRTKMLELPTTRDDIGFLPELQQRLLQTLELVDLSSEMARRETLIAPILLEICTHTKQKLKIEYAINVSQQLRGSLDYFIPATQNLLVIEAKQVDLARGFVQLGAELIALDQWTTSETPVLFGAITTGDTWKFGLLDRAQKTLLRDIRVYTVPSDLAALVATLLAIIQGASL